jgi:hypothetical protein
LAKPDELGYVRNTDEVLRSVGRCVKKRFILFERARSENRTILTGSRSVTRRRTCPPCFFIGKVPRLIPKEPCLKISCRVYIPVSEERST